MRSGLLRSRTERCRSAPVRVVNFGSSEMPLRSKFLPREREALDPAALSAISGGDTASRRGAEEFHVSKLSLCPLAGLFVLTLAACSSSSDDDAKNKTPGNNVDNCDDGA